MYPVFVNKFRFIRFQAMATVIMSVKGRYPYCLQRSKSRRRNTLSTWTFRHKKTHWYSFHFTYLLKHSCRYLRSHTVLSFTSKIRLTEICANFLQCLSVGVFNVSPNIDYFIQNLHLLHGHTRDLGLQKMFLLFYILWLGSGNTMSFHSFVNTPRIFHVDTL